MAIKQIEGAVEKSVGINAENATRYMVTQQVPSLYAGIKELAQNAIAPGTKTSKVQVRVNTMRIGVRDYGKGMTGKEVDENLCTLFNSSKTSGDLGEFGIGGKALVGREEVEKIEFTTMSIETKRKIIGELYMKEGKPVYWTKDLGETEEPSGTEVTVCFKNALDTNETAGIARTLASDLFAAKPAITIEADSNYGPITKFAGGVTDFKQLAEKYDGVYIKNENGEAVAFKDRSGVTLNSSRTYHTIQGLNISEEYNHINDLIIIVNVPLGKRVISATTLIDSSARSSLELEEQVLDRMIVKILGDEKEVNKRKFLKQSLERKIDKQPFDVKSERDLSSLLAILPPEVCDYKGFDGFNGKDWKISLRDLQIMAEKYKGNIFFATQEGGGRLDNVLEENGISFTSDKWVADLFNKMTYRGYKKHLVRVEETLKPSDLSVMSANSENSLTFKGYLGFLASPREFAQSVSLSNLKVNGGASGERAKFSIREAIKKIPITILTAGAFMVYSPYIAYYKLTHKEDKSAEIDAPKPTIIVKKEFVKIDPEKVKPIIDSMNRVTEDCGMTPHDMKVLGINLALPGVDFEIPDPRTIAFNNGHNLVLNYNSPFIRDFEKVIKNGKKEDAHKAALMLLVTTIAHEDAHGKERNHDLSFYGKMEEIQQTEVAKALRRLSGEEN